jgi:hypothetical protein
MTIDDLYRRLGLRRVHLLKMNIAGRSARQFKAWLKH